MWSLFQSVNNRLVCFLFKFRNLIHRMFFLKYFLFVKKYVCLWRTNLSGNIGWATSPGMAALPVPRSLTDLGSGLLMAKKHHMLCTAQSGLTELFVLNVHWAFWGRICIYFVHHCIFHSKIFVEWNKAFAEIWLVLKGLVAWICVIINILMWVSMRYQQKLGMHYKGL